MRSEDLVWFYFADIVSGCDWSAQNLLAIETPNVVSVANSNIDCIGDKIVLKHLRI